MQHLIQIDLKGWGAGYLPAFQQHCLLQMLNSVAGKCLRASFPLVSLGPCGKVISWAILYHPS